MQAVLDHRPHPNQTDSVRHERAEIPRGGIGNPHGREAIVLEELEEVPRIAAIRLRLPHHHGADLPGLPHQDGVPEPVHEGVKPLGVAGGLDPNRHRWPQCSIKLLDRIAVVRDFLLEKFARARVENSDLLLPRVQITSDECHESGLLAVGLVTVPQPEPTCSGGPFS